MKRKFRDVKTYSVDEVLEYFIKDFETKPSLKVINAEGYIDASKNKVIFVFDFEEEDNE